MARATKSKHDPLSGSLSLEPTDDKANTSGLVPFAWKDRKALIEVAFPAQKISIEAQTERKANAGQTLTALGSYWKGRKPLVLVRACVLASLLPVNEEDPSQDLEIFELLMAMDDDAFVNRQKSVSKEDVLAWAPDLAGELLEDDAGTRWKKGLDKEDKRRLLGEVLKRMPYAERLNKRSLRPEELEDRAYNAIWARVNAHLGTTATSHAELVEQLGILRFGHRPKVADTFCGGGSIPFEAARLGCDVYASDLNPIACMLTWGAFNIIGANEETREAIKAAQEKIAKEVDEEITRLGIEHDEKGNRAKAYLYCLEATCPQTGWSVPLAPSWIISHDKKTVAKLVPNHTAKRFDIVVESGVLDADFAAAKTGTVDGGDMAYVLDGKPYRTPIKTLRGDRRTADESANELRRWDKSDVAPRPDDILRERLYCIQWTGMDRRTFFRGITDRDTKNERAVLDIVRRDLSRWQAAGWVPDMVIEPGEKTDEPIRTRGWTQWHHLFNPRQLHHLALYFSRLDDIASPDVRGAIAIALVKATEWNSRLCRWDNSPQNDRAANVFSNQALNVFWNYACRAWSYLRNHVGESFVVSPLGIWCFSRSAIDADRRM